MDSDADWPYEAVEMKCHNRRVKRERVVTLSGHVDVPHKNETALEQAVSHTVRWGWGVGGVMVVGGEARRGEASTWVCGCVVLFWQRSCVQGKMQGCPHTDDPCLRPLAPPPCSPPWWPCAAVPTWPSGTSTRAASWTRACSA